MWDLFPDENIVTRFIDNCTRGNCLKLVRRSSTNKVGILGEQTSLLNIVEIVGSKFTH